MSTPLVSIITPAYNHEKFIGECIESVLAQNFGDWEQIGLRISLQLKGIRADWRASLMQSWTPLYPRERAMTHIAKNG